MMRRETQVVAGIAIFVIAVGVVAFIVLAVNQQPAVLDEHMWFRITSEDVEGSPLNSTLAMISITGVGGDFQENLLYVNDGDWQASEKTYEIGDVIRFIIFFYEGNEFYDATYRIGRGPVSVDLGNYGIDFISYWEMPDY